MLWNKRENEIKCGIGHQVSSSFTMIRRGDYQRFIKKCVNESDRMIDELMHAAATPWIPLLHLLLTGRTGRCYTCTVKRYGLLPRVQTHKELIFDLMRTNWIFRPEAKWSPSQKMDRLIESKS
jgi:hypothetical protein